MPEQPLDWTEDDGCGGGVKDKLGQDPQEEKVCLERSSPDPEPKKAQDECPDCHCGEAAEQMEAGRDLEASTGKTGQEQADR